MAAKVKRILMALGLILVLEAVPAISTLVLLLLFVRIEFFLGIEFLRLLGTALADEASLHLWATLF